MGGAIVKRLNLPTITFDRNLEKAKALGTAVTSPLENSSPSEVLILAVKPQDFDGSLYASFKGKLVISIMAGVSQTTLNAFFSTPTLVMMPNLAVEYGCGIVALAENQDLDKSFIENLLAPLGLLEWFPEKQFPAITALTGSGPAFFLHMLQAMQSAAGRMELPAGKTSRLIEEMILGTLLWLKQTNQSPENLAQKVTSKGGVTAAGLKTFKNLGVEEGIIQTFLAAFNHKFN